MKGQPNAVHPTATAPREAKAVLDVTVLMGGPSSERDVSLASGGAIADGLARKGHQVTCADITPEDTSALDRDGIDVVFIALHGEFGESGQVQELCEGHGLRYTGSGVRASSLAMDKAAAKQIVKRAGLATPDWMIIEDFHSAAQVATWLEEIAPPVVVKPVNGGSSVDVIIARDAAARGEAIDDLIDRYGRIMVERFIPGREITVGVVGERVLPVLEILPEDGFYDYRAKYSDDARTRYSFDPGLDASALAAIQHYAWTAHSALGCRHMSRTDFILDDQGQAHFLESNTIPGFTSHSLLPMAAEKIGIGFDQLVHELAMMAWQGT